MIGDPFRNDAICDLNATTSARKLELGWAVPGVAVGVDKSTGCGGEEVDSAPYTFETLDPKNRS